ncbi:MAG TPA: alpha/beta fold hydrolase [Labilithrix sp.]|nr:alpha/beta fold hydrolase [Labilithrix sp.]
MRFALCLSALGLTLAGASASCSEDTPEPLSAPPPPAAVDAGPVDAGPVTLENCTGTPEDVYGDPGPLAPDPNARGNVLKCTKAPEVVTKEVMQAKLAEHPEHPTTSKPLTSNVRVYRVAYRTERGDAASTPAISSAIVYVPETPRAGKLPIVVAARGSRGQAARCAVSKFDPSLEGINGDAYRMVYALAGYGYAVIMPDLAGYANFGAPGNPPSAYAQAADVARSTLDGARALKKLVPSLDDKVVLVGHSQGGFSALAALALSESYGTAAPIVGTAVYAPLWLSQRSWGAVLFESAGKDFPLATSIVGNVSVWYHYTEAELLDGPGEGKKLFAPDKQAAIESFVKNECWGSQELAKLGTYAHELFDPAFASAVAVPAALGDECQAEHAEVCKRWVERYKADRPNLKGAAATTPLLLAYGLKDTTIPPNRMKCALDRLITVDHANVTACVDAEQTHGGIVSARGEYVADWIASLTLGEPAPAACATNESAITESCAFPPPND